MEYRVRLNLFSTALVIAIGIATSVITSTVVAARAYQSRGKQLVSSQRDITVKGSARERVTSDVGVWSVTVKAEGTTLAAGYESLDQGVQKVVAFLKEQGFSDAEIVTSAIDIEPHHKRDEHQNVTWQIESYGLKRELTITSPAVAKFALAGGEVTRLIKDGVSVQSGTPRYYYSKIADLKVQILGQAARDALARAEEIVKNSGGKVGDVRSVQMGVLQITVPNSTEVSGSGIYDTETIEKDVTAVVTVTYGLQ